MEELNSMADWSALQKPNSTGLTMIVTPPDLDVQVEIKFLKAGGEGELYCL